MAKRAKRPTKSKTPTKSKKSRRVYAKPTTRDRKIRERIHQSGNYPKADEAFLAITLEIDSKTNQSPPPRFGEVGARIAAAKQAFEDAILSGDDDLSHWIEAARRAANL